MRGRKNDEEFANSNVERSNDKEAIAEPGANNNYDLMKTLNNFLKLNNNGNLEEQLSLIDQTYPAGFGQSPSNGQLSSLHRAGYEPFVNRRFPLFNSRLYGPNQQITPFLGLMTRYGSPKRAGFVPMRGRKSDPNVLLTNDEDEDFSPYSFKRAGFLPVSFQLRDVFLTFWIGSNNKNKTIIVCPSIFVIFLNDICLMNFSFFIYQMRGKKSSIDLDDLDQYNQKRAFHALRG